MRILILMGSPRHGGNTAELCKPFREELERLGAETRYMTLSDKNIHPCLGCYACQDVEGTYSCVQHDGMYEVVDSVLWADCVVLATPVYTWYCTAPMKAVLDRHYGLNKFYGSARGSLWKGKYVAILTTHGWDNDAGCYYVELPAGEYVWAALYEGSYTADTLPPYVPKGYAAELAQCRDKWTFDAQYDCWCLEDVLYTQKADVPKFQRLSIFVPAAYMNADGTPNPEGAMGRYTARSAPVGLSSTSRKNTVHHAR